MAIYHFSAKVISRAAGSSAVASAAYRSAERLHDQRLDRDHDFTNKSGVVHNEVLLPEGAPERFGDRATLWNEVEATELRKDAQLCREVEFAIPREMSQHQGIELARDFVQSEFVDRGMIADLNVHWDIGGDGEAKPHVHVIKHPFASPTLSYRFSSLANLMSVTDARARPLCHSDGTDLAEKNRPRSFCQI